MATQWTVTIDSAHPGALAQFWCLALGYVEKPPPDGFDSWQAWFKQHKVPEEEWDDGAYVCDPEGAGPNISFLKVPEGKVVKNRVHLDIQIGGGRATPLDVRWPRVLELVDRLKTAGATVILEDYLDGKPDHIIMADPEGNEFCVL